MIIRKLSKEEKTQVLKITHDDVITQINMRKDFINQIIMTWLRYEIPNPKKAVFFLFCQFGKTVLNKLILDGFLAKNPSTQILCVFPEERLWDDSKKLQDSRVHNIIVNSIEKWNSPTDVLLLDEGQYYTNPSSKRNVKVFDIDYKHIFINCAFLESDQIKFLEQKGINYGFEIQEKEGIQLGLLPPNYIYNIAIELNDFEKYLYAQNQTSFKNYVNMLDPFYQEKSAWVLQNCISDKYKVKKEIVEIDPITKKEITKTIEIPLTQEVGEYLELNKGQVIGIAIKYLASVRKRQTLLKEAQNKFPVLLSLLKFHQDERAIIYVNSEKCALKVEKLLNGKGIVYSSKSDPKKKNLERFRKKEFQYIIIIGKGTVGKIDETLTLAIHLAYESKALKTKQKKSRVQTIDPNNPLQEPVNYYLYCEDFILNEIEYSFS